MIAEIETMWTFRTN